MSYLRHTTISSNIDQFVLHSTKDETEYLTFHGSQYDNRSMKVRVRAYSCLSIKKKSNQMSIFFLPLSINMTCYPLLLHQEPLIENHIILIMNYHIKDFQYFSQDSKYQSLIFHQDFQFVVEVDVLFMIYFMILRSPYPRCPLLTSSYFYPF